MPFAPHLVIGTIQERRETKIAKIEVGQIDAIDGNYPHSCRGSFLGEHTPHKTASEEQNTDKN